MALLPERGDPTLLAVDQELERRSQREQRRSYLGASAIGDSCERKLWFSIRPEYARAALTASGIRAIEDGHSGEALMADRLRMVPGVRLWTADEHTGGQIGGALFDGRFQWHVDGVIVGLLQAPTATHCWEHKQVNQKKFDTFRKLKRELGEKEALAAWDYVYFAQAQVYMLLLDLDRHYLTVATPGGRDYESCRTELMRSTAEALLAKAKRVLTAAEIPEGISTNINHPTCKWCGFQRYCYVPSVP